MKLLILGGTVFLGRATAVHALTAGHDVTCAARGESGAAPAGVTWVGIDRDEPDGLAPLGDSEFDAVIDVTRRPSHARRAVEALADRTGHWTFVSTGSVYADDATPGQRADSAPVMAAAPVGVDDPDADPAAYGPCKVACEEVVRAAVGPRRSFICRAGLIVGPEDPSGRFAYWVERLARGGTVLAPGQPDDAVQFVDVRDLAGWLVHAAQVGLSGVYDGIGAPMSRADLLDGVARGLGTEPTLTWVNQEFLTSHGVQPWSGERSLPMWLPLPEYAGFLTRDAGPALGAGLVTRDIAETARDTLSWVRSTATDRRRPGLTADEEAELLAEFAGQ
ncbi:MAG TPA: NAD-dependent epimerase/dehydratase family protein [Micromonosporaceae bacterium]|nr:NAD-dependent epimerase/dehydratase family protein [Micromonosporaceae bacterium]